MNKTKLNLVKKYPERIFFRMENIKTAKKQLYKRPFRLFKDLAAFYIVQLSQNHCEEIDNFMMVQMQTTEEELYNLALKNTFEKWVLVNQQELIDNMIKSGTISKEDVCMSRFLPFEVLQINKCNYGAGAIMCHDIFENISNGENDLLIIPSSIYELLILKGHDVKNMINNTILMVKEVNRTEIREDEILSDCVYFYDHISNMITMCS